MKNFFEKISESKAKFSLTSIALFLIALSAIYGFVIRPIQDDKPYRDCIASAENIFALKVETFEKAFTNGHIDNGEKLGKQASARVALEEEKAKCFKNYKK